MVADMATFNREAWLHGAVIELEQVLGITMPDKYRVSCGFPHGSRTAIGQCWSPTASDGEATELFVSPALSDPVEVLATLLHEMVHAIVGVDKKHGPVFKALALEVGLTGRMTATVAGPDLLDTLCRLRDDVLPVYPHDSLQGKTTGKKKDGIRQLKCVCPECGYVIRTSQKWVDAGLPTCVCGTAFVREG